MSRMPKLLRRLVRKARGLEGAARAAVLRKHRIHADIVLPGQIAIDLKKLVFFNIRRRIGIGMRDMADLGVRNVGEPGFMDHYVLSIETMDHTHLQWRLCTDQDQGEQAARTVNDVLCGVLTARGA